MLTTSLAQPTYNDQSATECDAHVIERLDDVTGQLTHLHHDVAAALQRAPATSGSNCEREYSNMAQLHADVSAIRHAMESLNVPRRSLTNYTSAECYVDVRSYGCNDGAFKGGHIRVNWTMVQSISTSGIFLVIVDPVTCTGRPFPVVNVAGGGTAAANVLINYLNIVTKGQVLVGATGHDPRANLNPAILTLAEYGVNVTSLDRCGKFAFVALKGSPQRTTTVVKTAAQGNAWLVVKVLGSTEEDLLFLRLNP